MCEAGEWLARVQKGHDAVDLAVGQHLIAPDASGQAGELRVDVNSGSLIGLPGHIGPVLCDQAGLDD